MVKEIEVVMKERGSLLAGQENIKVLPVEEQIHFAVVRR